MYVTVWWHYLNDAQWFYGYDDGTLTTAWLGDPTITLSVSASNVTLKHPTVPLLSLSGNTGMVTSAVSSPTENCPWKASTEKKISPAEIQKCIIITDGPYIIIHRWNWITNFGDQ